MVLRNVLISLLLALSIVWAAVVSSSPLAWASEPVPGGPFNFETVMECEPLRNRTLLVVTEKYEYLFSIFHSVVAQECSSVKQDKTGEVSWVTHIGHMPMRYFTHAVPMMVRRVGVTEWDFIGGRTWDPRCGDVGGPGCKQE